MQYASDIRFPEIIHSTIFEEPSATITASPITLIDMFPDSVRFRATNIQNCQVGSAPLHFTFHIVL
jgi:hypothetical protein